MTKAKKIDIDTQLKAIQDEKQANLDKLTQLKNREKDLKAQQRKQQRELTRQQDTRRKILLGAFLLDVFKKNPNYKAQMEKHILDFANKTESEKARELNVEALKGIFD